MNTAEVIYIGGLRTENTHLKSGSKMNTDAPIDNFGKGESFSPTDLLAVSLANCMLTTMAIQTRLMDIKLEGTTARVTKHMGVDPRRVIKIDVDIDLPKNVEEHKAVLEAAAHHCPVAKSLHPDIKQNVTFNYVLLK
jgi:putative redox protein